MGRPRLSWALRTRYWTVFLCRVSRCAVALKLPFSCKNTCSVSRSRALTSSSTASAPRVSTTQARTRSTELDISASGATSAKLVTAGAAVPAASATAWAPSACWWVRRKPGRPAPTAPNANRISSSDPAAVGDARTANVSRLPSGSQAHAHDSSWGRKIGRPVPPAWPATSAIACSSRSSAPLPGCVSVTQHTTPTWCCRRRYPRIASEESRSTRSPRNSARTRAARATLRLRSQFSFSVS